MNKTLSPYLEGLADSTLPSRDKVGTVSGFTKLTNTAFKPITRTSKQTTSQQTLEPSQLITFQSIICSLEDFLAKHSASLENEEVLKIPEAHCFLRLQEYLKLKDLHIFYLKTSRGYSITTTGKLLPSSFKRWMNWGMILNGWYLTANFSRCRD